MLLACLTTATTAIFTERLKSASQLTITQVIHSNHDEKCSDNHDEKCSEKQCVCVSMENKVSYPGLWIQESSSRKASMEGGDLS